MPKKAAGKKAKRAIAVRPNPVYQPTPEEIRRQKFQNLAIAFGYCLDQLVEDGIRHLTDMALSPVKNTLMDAAKRKTTR